MAFGLGCHLFCLSQHLTPYTLHLTHLTELAVDGGVEGEEDSQGDHQGEYQLEPEDIDLWGDIIIMKILYYITCKVLL